MLNSGEKLFTTNCGPLMMDRRWKTNIEKAPNCPRCASSNTKFCYYNNYSLSQPRYFCKACRRYWTKGGSLRNVPQGGGCRKNRRGKSVRAPSLGLDKTGISSQPSSSDDSSNGGGGNGIAASDIDLAVVFSKFLDPNSCLDHGSNNVSHISNQDSDLVDHDVASESNLQEDFITYGVDQPRGGEEFVDPANFESRLNEMEMLLSDGISEDILWSDPPSFLDMSWQDEEQQVQECQIQRFEGVVDDHSMFHTNSLNENWGSLDILSYGA